MADDFVQEVFVKAWHARASYDTAYTYELWLNVILLRTSRDEWRRARVREATPSLYDRYEGGAGRWHGQPGADVMAEVEGADLRGRLRAMLADLNELDREVLSAWARVDDVGYHEWTEAQSLERGTARVRLMRAKRRLRTRCEMEFGPALGALR